MFAMKAMFVAKNDKVSFQLWKTIARLSIKGGQQQSKIGLTGNFCVALALPLLPVGNVDPIPFHLLPLGSPKSVAIIMGWTWQQCAGPGMCFSSSRVWLCGWALWLTPRLALLADTSLGAVLGSLGCQLTSVLPWMLFSLSHTSFIVSIFFLGGGEGYVYGQTFYYENTWYSKNISIFQCSCNCFPGNQV